MTDFLASLPAHLLAILLLAVVPPSSAAAFRMLRERGRIQPEERAGLYRDLAVTQGVLAAWAAGAVALLDWSEAAAWWSVPELDPASAGALAIAVLLLVFFAWEERRLDHLPPLLRPVRVLLPRTRRERVRWLGISVTAGVCEEILYRGFLFWYLLLLFPEMSPVALLVAASALFGLGHLYQGRAGVLATTAVGFIFGAFYLATGSLWIPILLHALADARVALLRREVVEEPAVPGDL